MSGRAHPPARLLAVVAPVSLVGLTAYAVATVAFARDPGSATTIAGVGAFLLASTLAERFPVPVEGADANGVSLGFVFAVAALVLFGWAPATFVYATAPTLVALGRRNPFIRTIFNAGVFGLTGALAGWVLTQFHGDASTASVLRPRRGDRGDPVHRQPRARERGDRRVRLRDQLPEARRLERALAGAAVHADGVDGADARRAVAAHAVPDRRARRSARSDLALPAVDTSGAEGDAARAHRSADRPRATTATFRNDCSGS